MTGTPSLFRPIMPSNLVFIFFLKSRLRVFILILAGFGPGLGLVSLSAQTEFPATPAPSPAALPPGSDTTLAIDPNYLLTPGDELSLSIFGESNLSTTVVIDRSGKVRLPLVGEVSLTGLNVRAAEQLIEQTYIQEEMLKTPEVTLRMRSYAVRELIILGAVRSPGPFKFPLDTTSLELRDVISRLGGFSPVARADNITVTRRSPETGAEIALTVNLESLQTGRIDRSGEAPFLVYPGDRIFVPERLF
jgi:protein involved in polysaccharide export with SLBB domain